MEETQTIVVHVQPAPASQSNIDDYNELGGLLLLAIVVVWGMRRLVNIFTSDAEK